MCRVYSCLSSVTEISYPSACLLTFIAAWHTHRRMCTCRHIHTCSHLLAYCTHTNTHTHTHTHTLLLAHSLVHTHMHIARTETHIRIHMHTHTHTHTRKHTYTHTHTHIIQEGTAEQLKVKKVTRTYRILLVKKFTSSVLLILSLLMSVNTVTFRVLQRMYWP